MISEIFISESPDFRPDDLNLPMALVGAGMVIMALFVCGWYSPGETIPLGHHKEKPSRIPNFYTSSGYTKNILYEFGYKYMSLHVIVTSTKSSSVQTS